MRSERGLSRYDWSVCGVVLFTLFVLSAAVGCDKKDKLAGGSGSEPAPGANAVTGPASASGGRAAQSIGSASSPSPVRRPVPPEVNVYLAAAMQAADQILDPDKKV